MTKVGISSLSISDFEIKYAQINDDHSPEIYIYENDEDDSGNKNG